MFLDSDDYVENDACEKLYNKAKKDDLDVVICDFYKEYENGKIRRNTYYLILKIHL